jgi:hypothetical protein
MRIHLKSSTSIEALSTGASVGREMPAWQRALLFYMGNYELIQHHKLKVGQKVRLGDKDNRVCRFCGKAKPEVTFKKIAHAIPEGLGNKSLESYYECDPCNEMFGSGIEDDLGKWSKPMRTLARISGKNGVPTLKRGGDQSWRIDYDRTDGFKITSYEDDPIFELDEANEQLTLKLRRESHVPLNVLKAFWKIAYTLLPERELPNFSHVLTLITTPFTGFATGKMEVSYVFQPGPMPPDLLEVTLMRRAAGVTNLPYMLLALRYGNETYTVVVPSHTQDPTIAWEPFPPFRFPDLIDPAEYGEGRAGKIDLSSDQPTKSDFTVVLHANVASSGPPAAATVP